MGIGTQSCGVKEPPPDEEHSRAMKTAQKVFVIKRLPLLADTGHCPEFVLLDARAVFSASKRRRCIVPKGQAKIAQRFVRVCRGSSARGPRAVFGALEAAGRGGGRHVERRKRTDPKVPTGTTERSPRFQPWVTSGKWPEPRPPSRRSGALARREGGRGERKDGVGPARSFVPDGTRFIFAPQPSDESLGYFQPSLRDVDLRSAKQVPSPGHHRQGRSATS